MLESHAVAATLAGARDHFISDMQLACCAFLCRHASCLKIATKDHLCHCRLPAFAGSHAEIAFQLLLQVVDHDITTNTHQARPMSSLAHQNNESVEVVLSPRCMSLLNLHVATQRLQEYRYTHTTASRKDTRPAGSKFALSEI